MKRHQLIFLSLFLIIISCKKDDEGTIDADHQINITSPEAEQTLWNEIKITTDITFNQFPSKVEFYLGEELLETVTSEPYEATFNSQDYDDGDYKIKVVSYDDLDEQVASKEVDFKIYNTLIDLTILGNSLKTNQYILLTTNKGELIDYIKTNNSGEAIIIKRPLDFNDTTFAMHNLVLMPIISNNYIFLESDYGMIPRKLTIGKNIDPFPEYTGDAILNFTNIPEFSFAKILVQNRSLIIDDFTKPLTINIYGENADAYLYLETETGPAYIQINDLIADNNYDITLSDLNYEMTTKNFEVNDPSFNILSFTLRGIQNSQTIFKTKDLFTKTFNDQSDIKTFEYNIPTSNLFDSYISTSQVTNDIVSYTNESHGSLPEKFSYIDAHASITGSNIEEISAEVSGNYDYIMSAWTNNISQSTTTNYTWSRRSKTIEIIHFPEIPNDIFDSYPEITETNFKNGDAVSFMVSLIDYESLSSDKNLSLILYPATDIESSLIKHMTVRKKF
ncbi:Ig-like domain-containing protein [Fulvivirga ligni]|uniref:Ig-like domain-containing protein n=1 Tax=Fulvivirga ligni TaxID=2904246 RepID=UPI001F48D142|nr:Ig-like domain-containing protein [Fulvivirga ligni]UII23781.1 Ig-like domain-containing protein [Fulvivirga ligni]